MNSYNRTYSRGYSAWTNWMQLLMLLSFKNLNVTPHTITSHDECWWFTIRWTLVGNISCTEAWYALQGLASSDGCPATVSWKKKYWKEIHYDTRYVFGIIWECWCGGWCRYGGWCWDVLCLQQSKLSVLQRIPMGLQVRKVVTNPGIQMRPRRKISPCGATAMFGSALSLMLLSWDETCQPTVHS